jgi:hypothetical protein
VLENVRWVTDRRAVAFSASGASRKQWGRTRIGKTKTPKTYGVLVLPMRFPLPLSACADATAWQSVAHLTFANTFWRSVPTFLVLLRTEAGGMPRYTTQVFLRIRTIRKIQNKRKELMVKFRLFRLFCLFRIL